MCQHNKTEKKLKSDNIFLVWFLILKILVFLYFKRKLAINITFYNICNHNRVSTRRAFIDINTHAYICGQCHCHSLTRRSHHKYVLYIFLAVQRWILKTHDRAKSAASKDRTRTDLIMDQYPDVSIKNPERGRRGAGVSIQIAINHGNQKCPTQWKKYLSDVSNKANIAYFLV